MNRRKMFNRIVSVFTVFALVFGISFFVVPTSSAPGSSIDDQISDAKDQLAGLKDKQEALQKELEKPGRIKTPRWIPNS